MKQQCNFVNVGRSKKNWSAPFTGNLDADWMFRQVKKNHALASDNVEFLEDPDSNKGTILAGGRPVGEFTVTGLTPNQG